MGPTHDVNLPSEPNEVVKGMSMYLIKIGFILDTKKCLLFITSSTVEPVIFYLENHSGYH